MKKLEEIQWTETYRKNKELEYETWQEAKGIALCNGDPVDEGFIDAMDNLKILVWEGEITEEEMEKIVLDSFEKNLRG